MKVAFIKYRDPMLFNKPSDNIYEEELKFLKPAVIRDAGILILEDEERVILGEANIAQDNLELDDWGVRHPYYRNVRVIHKSQILERHDHNWDGMKDE